MRSVIQTTGPVAGGSAAIVTFAGSSRWSSQSPRRPIDCMIAIGSPFTSRAAIGLSSIGRFGDGVELRVEQVETQPADHVGTRW